MGKVFATQHLIIVICHFTVILVTSEKFLVTAEYFKYQ